MCSPSRNHPSLQNGPTTEIDIISSPVAFKFGKSAKSWSRKHGFSLVDNLYMTLALPIGADVRHLVVSFFEESRAGGSEEVWVG